MAPFDRNRWHHHSEIANLLKNESEDLETITKEFTIIFDEIGLKSEEIKYTLRLGNTLNIEIEKVILFSIKK